MDSQRDQIRKYQKSASCVFRKTKEDFGGLSNMASGYPLLVNRIEILTSEALYQACRFPNLPDVQEEIIEQKSPMAAKMVGKLYRNETRDDWDFVRVTIMDWCLRVKLAQNWSLFGELLKTTGDLPIVEHSHRDKFWGAVEDTNDPDLLIGVNALGRLLMKLRQDYLNPEVALGMLIVEPLQIPDFKILGNVIRKIDVREHKNIQEPDRLVNGDDSTQLELPF